MPGCPGYIVEGMCRHFSNLKENKEGFINKSGKAVESSAEFLPKIEERSGEVEHGWSAVIIWWLEKKTWRPIFLPREAFCEEDFWNGEKRRQCSRQCDRGYSCGCRYFRDSSKYIIRMYHFPVTSFLQAKKYLGTGVLPSAM
jgi:hypothetical protein